MSINKSLNKVYTLLVHDGCNNLDIIKKNSIDDIVKYVQEFVGDARGDECLCVKEKRLIYNDFMHGSCINIFADIDELVIIMKSIKKTDWMEYEK